ncbi:hypothetical protein B0H12DRAFT_1124466 [Mycena haematopus]|nr:hypothetical protein B0H12DRAFT_1124466 [Mycena haematopus]
MYHNGSASYSGVSRLHTASLGTSGRRMSSVIVSSDTVISEGRSTVLEIPFTIQGSDKRARFRKRQRTSRRCIDVTGPSRHLC